MNEESLRELLARVHERLGHAHSVDAESRRLLVTVMDDIQRALGEGSASGAAMRLETLAARFEAEHPLLAQGLRQLVDALGKAGI